MSAKCKYQPYKVYMNRIAKSTSLFKCFFCATLLLAKNFQQHLLTDHSDQYTNKRTCPWCEGVYFWESAQKWKHVDHLDTCFKTFFERYPNNENNAIPLDNDPVPPAAATDPQPPPSPLPAEPTAAAAVAPVVVYTLNHELKTCSEKDLSNRELPESIDSTILCDDALFPLTPEMDWWHDVTSNCPNKLSFWDANDDLGIQTIKRMVFIKKRNPSSTIRFFHLMVRASSFSSFVEHMQLFGSDAFLLPFSCLCDGGNTIPRKRGSSSNHNVVNLHRVGREHLIHRHMILVAKDGSNFLKSCWQHVGKVKRPAAAAAGGGGGPSNSAAAGPSNSAAAGPSNSAAGPSSNNNNNSNEHGINTRKYVRIDDWFHLKNAIMYVSNVRSSCNFHSAKTELIQKFPYNEQEEEDPNSQRRPNRNNNNNNDRNHHFYITRSITKYFPWMAALSIEGGVQKELTQQFSAQKVENYFQHVEYVRSETAHCRKYAVKIRNIVRPHETLLNQVMPVAKDFYPVAPHTNGFYAFPSNGDYYFHLPKRHYLNFSMDTNRSLRISDREWYDAQAASGVNLFMNVIGDYHWYPPKKLQRILGFGFALKAFYEQDTAVRIATAVRRATEDLIRQKEDLIRQNDRLVVDRDAYLDYIDEIQQDHPIDTHDREMRDELVALRDETTRKENDHKLQIRMKNDEMGAMRDELVALRDETTRKENDHKQQIRMKNDEMGAMRDELVALRDETTRKETKHQLDIRIKNDEMGAMRDELAALRDETTRKENDHKLQMRRKENHLNIKNQQMNWKENQIRCKSDEMRRIEKEHQQEIRRIEKEHKLQIQSQNDEIRRIEKENQLQIQNKYDDIINLYKMQVEVLQKQIEEYKNEIKRLVHLLETSYSQNKALISEKKELIQELPECIFFYKRKKRKLNNGY